MSFRERFVAVSTVNVCESRRVSYSRDEIAELGVVLGLILLLVASVILCGLSYSDRWVSEPAIVVHNDYADIVRGGGRYGGPVTELDGCNVTYRIGTHLRTELTDDFRACGPMHSGELIRIVGSETCWWNSCSTDAENLAVPVEGEPTRTSAIDYPLSQVIALRVALLVGLGAVAMVYVSRLTPRKSFARRAVFAVVCICALMMSVTHPKSVLLPSVMDHTGENRLPVYGWQDRTCIGFYCFDEARK